jgi:predicted phosphodiesterase
MNIAILSDLHSNHFALKAVLDDIGNRSLDKLVVLGDIFGYYPWACETYQLLKPYKDSAFIIKGNHDQLVIDQVPPEVVPSYWQAAKINEAELKAQQSGALEWLQMLDFGMEIKLADKFCTLLHGTPADKKEGRYYPDDQHDYNWFPKNGHILLMGHTHYPIYKKFDDNSIIINPGSVGQPRDADPRSSWGILNCNDLSYLPIRTPYDNIKAMNLLEKMDWDKRTIAALNKTEKGILKL